ncbi:MAG: hypothetical protein UU73_C0004G0030 [Candidatus Daviesbacteria bacterium GW2011_GWA1_41_61]|uniref:Putative pre-16S rRNA nuclease n=1 Tax=Candidatus Daviesbacteria bacterium GW2011_GWA2_40_9 TaxID=1618424 RepID=A0A0G0WGB8_9BACT|nr:MAG: hypothetical protein UU26_C0011G0005 [Candidatus Daviesbacteria bacterium GW2011_GWC1_40_9]KKR83335.1 MAG: hypothetical protein UU29_C0006G0024 [Candidatus Daviesbacteria bacterium GW2011_GWA2_40_9]KKR93234.1 MAG: hypothetical protein UU44_C0003G0030 [Candidatus Daviesbacteria bacterium GW2011_GWB1_41_15]KKS14722.1 MAG: hypothetical protein UU73_C0004G0030 [Candidatus Daviesbacteria bacterium GW2011_GWA1_41_61]
MKYLGVDWGLKRVGLAISEGKIASPLAVLSVNSLQDGLDKLISFIKREEIDIVVIGKPEGESGKRVEAVVKKLKKVGLKVIEADETLSTQEAKKFLLRIGVSRKSRRLDDAWAATIILQRFLDEQP